MNNKYIGHQLQLFGVEEMRLQGGKGDNMRMYCVRNACGLEFYVCPDRCADIMRVTFKGDNMGYMTACGYVSPKYYDHVGAGFLKSFTAGFLTTCGLQNVGSPNTDQGEELPLHGSISNTPCDNIAHWIENDEIHIKAIIRDARLFSNQLILEREYVCPVYKNELYLTDTIRNIGSMTSPIQLMYHCNMGYPLLSENSQLSIPAQKTVARNEHAQSGFDRWSIMEKPQKGYEEMCYFHTMTGNAEVSIYNPDINKGMKMSYDTEELPYFTEWKMMGEYDYVLGLEPGICGPEGRASSRADGTLVELEAGKSKTQHLKFEFIQK